MYVEMKWMQQKTDWTSLTPEDLAKAALLTPYKLSELKLIKK